MNATLSQQIDEVLDQLDNIESMCGLFYNQRRFTIYKNLSATLRIILTGSSGQLGLMAYVLPNGQLLPLRKVPDPATPPDLLVLPARVQIERGEAKVQVGNGTVTVRDLNVLGGAVDAMDIGEMFESAGAPLSLADWLKQPFLRPTWTLKSFIGIVTNKDGGAHHDPNEALLAMQKWGHFHWHVTAGIARSILPQMRSQLSAVYPNHVRAIR